jgi:dihydroxyacetone kinase-like predicted kinase
VLAVASVEEAVLGLLEIAGAAEYELITLFHGADLAIEEVEQVSEAVRRAYPRQEIEVQAGGQPHYHFIISIE